MDICIDFDGTCVSHEYPEIGQDIGAFPVLRRLVLRDHRLILFTMRSDVPGGRQYLSEAVQLLTDQRIALYGIQENPTQKEWTTSPKAYGQLYIDDAGLGIPLRTDPRFTRPFVNWGKVEYLLEKRGIL